MKCGRSGLASAPWCGAPCTGSSRTRRGNRTGTTESTVRDGKIDDCCSVDARHLIEKGAMRRPIAILGAPSSIGIRPYDQGGQPRHLDRAPGVLRELGLVNRLGADDLGDVVPPPYRDFT